MSHAEGVAPAATRRIAVGVSGTGRSLANMLAMAHAGSTQFEIGAVFASKSDCPALAMAGRAGLPTFVNPFAIPCPPSVQRDFYAWLAQERIAWIALAGFTRPLPVNPRWAERTVNIHPALLPAFGGRGMYGDKVHAAVLASGATRSGPTVHLVTERYDEGRIISQSIVRVLAADDVSSLAARVFAAELELYPETLDRLVSGRLPLADGGVWQYQRAGEPS